VSTYLAVTTRPVDTVAAWSSAGWKAGIGLGSGYGLIGLGAGCLLGLLTRPLSLCRGAAGGRAGTGRVPGRDPGGTDVGSDPRWWASSAFAGTEFVAKFAWSQTAALRLRNEIGVLTTLPPVVPYLPEVVVGSTDAAWVDAERYRSVLRWCDWSDAVLAAPGPGPDVLVHADLHGDNQVWDHGELRVVLDFETVRPGGSRCPGP
jgi:phosphotransferase family enzyme